MKQLIFLVICVAIRLQNNEWARLYDRLNACMLNLRNHSCKTSLKPDARPQEAETHSAISRWKHIVKATCSYGERKQTYVGKTRCHRPRRWSDDSSILRASHAGCRAALETSTWPGTSTTLV